MAWNELNVLCTYFLIIIFITQKQQSLLHKAMNQMKWSDKGGYFLLKIYIGGNAILNPFKVTSILKQIWIPSLPSKRFLKKKRTHNIFCHIIIKIKLSIHITIVIPV